MSFPVSKVTRNGPFSVNAPLPIDEQPGPIQEPKTKPKLTWI